MANSDNVLRGGLTPKHVDAPELLRVLDFTPTTEAALRPESPGTEWNSSITRRRRSSQCRCSVSTAARPRDRRACRPSRTADPVVHGRLDGGARKVQRADAGVRSGHLGVGRRRTDPAGGPAPDEAGPRHDGRLGIRDELRSSDVHRGYYQGDPGGPTRLADTEILGPSSWLWASLKTWRFPLCGLRLDGRDLLVLDRR
jgi:Phosphomannose isomerase type I